MKWMPNYLDILAAIVGRGIKHYAVPLKTPRDWLEWHMRGRITPPTPRPPVGGLRYEQLQRRRAAQRKRRGPCYAKRAKREYRQIGTAWQVASRNWRGERAA